MITIQKLKSIRKPGGIYEDTWTDLKEIDINPVIPSGSEYLQGKSINEKVYIDIYIDYDDEIKSNMRVKFMDYTLEIESILPKLPDINGDYRKMVIKCYETNI